MRLITLAAGAALLAAPAWSHGGHGGLAERHQNKPTTGALPTVGRQWLPGDHHIHSEYSADYEADPASPQTAPIPLIGKDGRYSITRNAQMARQFGLRWMVSTDHGGPNHSKLNYEQAWPEVNKARAAVPEMLIFYGMEFDTPAGDHSSLIIPFTGDEREQLRAIESGFSKREPWPQDKAWDSEGRMIDALKLMRDQKAPPVLIANHPSRSATAPFAWGQYTPAEFRNWNDTAPRVAIGMEGAPGHQAGAIKPDGSPDPTGNRGGYGRAPTLGGFWDSMLAEGRRWFITATSDSHANWRDGGNDFWPGEYSKTYVQARPDHADIIDGLRSGRIFVTTGDLVSEVEVIASSGNRKAGIGGTLSARNGRPVDISIRLRDPAAPNAAERTPEVARIDLISGPITGPAANRSTDRAAGTGVIRRFTASDWRRDGEVLTMTYRIPAITGPLYLRVRGTSTAELEPSADPKGEDPWADLWFYANPIFITVK
ncbi:CehA/McbA family metallohydrolase domain-containing protein [Sandarakinorhabdus rubra]|uniref:phosphoesterase n=1 Tax=Sandarakinorhabdus rubra TaxID=2672568 RepID=UPI0013DD6E28|nr:phosphoesterase [Sandarakinorhabdus rubra]